MVTKQRPEKFLVSLVRWHKVLNRGYSQRRGGAEVVFESSDETTDEPVLACRRDFYKVETIEPNACCSPGRVSTRQAQCLPTMPGVVPGAVDHSALAARWPAAAAAGRRKP